MRKVPFEIGEIYHVYNRGTDKRVICNDEYDADRFLQSLVEFNTLDPIGSLYEHSFIKKRLLGSSTSKSKEVVDDGVGKLVNIIAYCLNTNHYHLILEQLEDRGIERFMQRFGTGYTKYFNNKYERSGVLFQGRFQSVHIASNEQLLYVSTYVNLNFRVHKYDTIDMFRIRSSWDEYIEEGDTESSDVCSKERILEQFQHAAQYKEFSEQMLVGMIEKKQRMKMNDMFLE